MGNYIICQMFENPRRGRQATNSTANVSQIVFRTDTLQKLSLGAPVGSSRLPLTFVHFCPLSVGHQQKLKQYNYHVDRSEIPTRFWTVCPHQYGISVIEV